MKLLATWGVFLATLAALAQPVIIQPPTNTVVVGGTTATLSVVAGGSGPLTYQWQFNGSNLPPNGSITTVAGNGSAGFSGDGGPATNASLFYPQGMCADNQGNLYFVDTGNNRVRRIDSHGIITTVAGNGINNFAGDQGPATNASVSLYYYYLYCTGMAADGAGNVFFADTVNQRIRKVDSNGFITTVAGNGIAGFGGDGGVAVNANLNYPSGVTADANGNLFVADSYNGRIRKVTTNGIITTFAGGGSNFGDGLTATNASLAYPRGVAVDVDGNLLIADYGNGRIAKVDVNGIITTVAGNGNYGYLGDGGPATNASVSPGGVAADNNGNILISDVNNHRIRKVSQASYLPAFAINGVAQTNAGNYSVVVTSASGSVTSSVANLTVIPATIAQAPQSQTVPWGGNATFNLVATSPQPFACQWFFTNPSLQSTAGASAVAIYGNVIGVVVTNGGSGYTTVPNVTFSGGGGTGALATAVVSNGQVTAINMINYGAGYTNVPAMLIDPPNGWLIGQTNTTLVLSAVTPANAGSYYAVLSNAFATASSPAASLSVTPIVLSQPPQNQTVLTGGTATFTATVTVSATPPLGYQWYFVNPALQTTAGARAETLYGFVYGAAITNGGAGYTTVPQVQFAGGGGIGAGGLAAISNGMVTAITVTNTGFGYTSMPAVVIDPPNGLIPGATNSSLTISNLTPANAGNYYLVLTNSYGSITSSLASLEIAYPPSLLQQPQAQTAAPGGSAVFSVTAAGTPPLAYQWWQVSARQCTATATPFLINGFVLAATITSGGAGYLAPPAVQITGGSGIGATATASISNGVVTAITIINPGIGYTVAPTMQIAPPPALALGGQTNSSLALTNLTAANLGNYYVVVSNNFGSVTSSLAGLNFASAAPQSLTLQPVATGWRCQFTGSPNQTYFLQATTNLIAPIHWQPFATNTTDANGTWNLTVTNRPAGPAQFFRAASQY